MRPDKPAASIKRAKKLRREMTLPEVLLWQILRTAPHGHKFRKQHPAGPYVLDFFCARANLAIEIDGQTHDTGDRPQRDQRRDEWLHQHRIDTLRLSARDVLKDVTAAAVAIVGAVDARMTRFSKTPPSVANATATSPSQVEGEDLG
jgi:very-short-patch-repair endonuclease